ncbi:MAG: hypothetical protein ACK4S4_13610 [Pyrinomonadaceae bacterium]
MKMRDTTIKSEGCRPGDELVSYIYGEMPVERLKKFEEHLPGCETCISELAALSESRFDIYEWRSRAFEPLQTPVFDNPASSVSVGRAAGLLEYLSGAFASWSTGSTIAAGAAAALIVVGIAGAALLGRGIESLPADVAAIEADDPVPGPSTPVLQGPADSSEPSAAVRANRRNSRSSDERAAAREPRRPASPPAIRRAIVADAPRTQLSGPGVRGGELHLNDFDYEEDASLRLADLFEEVGSR